MLFSENNYTVFYKIQFHNIRFFGIDILNTENKQFQK